MKFKVLGSGSSGNCYLLISSAGETLVIEAGVRFSDVLKEVNHRQIAGLIVSHAHGDHAGFLSEFLNRRITTRIHDESLKEWKGKTGAFLPLYFEEERKFSLGRFDIIPFRLKHDTPCFGFLIRHPDMTGNFLFCTDTSDIPYTFDNVQTLAIEADYDYSMLLENVNNGKIHVKLARRIHETHYSIDDAIRFCKNRDTKKLRNIILLHLSSRNSSAEIFKERMIMETGKPTYIASKGLEVEVGNNPF